VGGGCGGNIDRGYSAGFKFIFVSLLHPNNRFENICILYLPLFNSVAKKTIL
jgi:hypothetical protein